MRNLKIEATQDLFSPSVSLDANTGFCEIVGESYVEDALEFYQPIMDWLEQHMEEDGRGLQFDFKLTYLNTSSYKEMLGVLKILEKYKKRSGSVEINWHYPEDDLDMLAEAEDMAETAKLEINFIPYQLDY